MNRPFGHYIRALRKERGLTQRGLSQLVGFRSLAHLSDIEGGKRYPAKSTLVKFAAALGVSLADLESRDTRGPVEAAKALFARRPEMVGAFLKVLAAAQDMNAEELVGRITGSFAVPPVVRSSRKKEIVSEPTQPLEPTPEAEKAGDPVGLPVRDPVLPVTPSEEAAVRSQRATRKSAVENPDSPSQPTLF